MIISSFCLNDSLYYINIEAAVAQVAELSLQRPQVYWMSDQDDSGYA